MCCAPAEQCGTARYIGQKRETEQSPHEIITESHAGSNIYLPSVRLVVLYTSSICTNEPTGEDLYAGWINGRNKKGIPFRLGTWIGMIG